MYRARNGCDNTGNRDVAGDWLRFGRGPLLRPYVVRGSGPSKFHHSTGKRPHDAVLIGFTFGISTTLDEINYKWRAVERRYRARRREFVQLKNRLKSAMLLA